MIIYKKKNIKTFFCKRAIEINYKFTWCRHSLKADERPILEKILNLFLKDFLNLTITLATPNDLPHQKLYYIQIKANLQDKVTKNVLRNDW